METGCNDGWQIGVSLVDGDTTVQPTRERAEQAARLVGITITEWLDEFAALATLQPAQVAYLIEHRCFRADVWVRDTDDRDDEHFVIESEMP